MVPAIYYLIDKFDHLTSGVSPDAALLRHSDSTPRGVESKPMVTEGQVTPRPSGPFPTVTT